MNRFKNSKLLFWTVEVLAVAGLVFVLSQIDFVFRPITALFAAVFIPFLFAGFLYYVFDPVLTYLEQKVKLPRMVGTLLSVLLVIGGYVYVAISIIPSLIDQMTGLVNTTLKSYPAFQKWVEELARSERFKDIFKALDLKNVLNNLNISYAALLKNLLDGTTAGVNSIVNLVVSMIIVLILIPILLYYLLKDGRKILPYVKRNILGEDKYRIESLLKGMNQTISRYVFGLGVDALFVFVAVVIGYLIMGVPYAFLFALFSAAMSLVPYVGPYIGVMPVVLSLAFQKPWLALIAVAYTLLIQQIDGNLIYPKVVGTAVRVHPVTVMVLMLVMGSLGGLLGMIVAVPLYAVIKEIVKFSVTLYRNIRTEKLSQIDLDA